MAKWGVKTLLSVLSFLLITFLCLEVALQVSVLIKPSLIFTGCDELYWKLSYLRSAHKNVESIVMRPHAVRGWAPRPACTFVDKGKTYSFNKAGFRSTKELRQVTPGKLRVMIVGDSFTFGWDCSDEENWPSQLEKLDNSLYVMNYGVGAYGVGQMLLTAEEFIEKSKPDVLIVAYIDDDLFRTMLSFRDYKKPCFKLVDGKLRLTNCPIGSFKDVKRELGQHRLYGLLLPKLLTRVGRYLCPPKYGIDFGQFGGKEYCYELNARLLDEFAALAKKSDASLVAVHLAWGRFLGNSRDECFGEAFMERYLVKRKINYINTRTSFFNNNKQWHRGHYQKAEAAVVANCVLDQLKHLGLLKAKG